MIPKTQKEAVALQPNGIATSGSLVSQAADAIDVSDVSLQQHPLLPSESISVGHKAEVASAFPIRLTSYDPQKYLELRIYADTFYQLQRNRIMMSNRVKSGSVPIDVLAEPLMDMKAVEEKVAKAMRKSFRRAAPELYKWSKTEAAQGLGEHLLARLIGVIGHPLYAQPYHWEGIGKERVLVADEPFRRSLSQLRQYCGYGNPTLRRRSGMSAEDAAAMGKPQAKMILRLLAESTMKCVGPTKAKLGDMPKGKTATDALLLEPVGLAISSPKPDVLAPDPAGALLSPSPTISVPTTINLSSVEGDDLAASPVDPISVPSTTQPSETGDATSLKGVKRRSPFRDIYDDARDYYPLMHPDWTTFHCHNAALRKVAKAIIASIYMVYVAVEEDLVAQQG